MAGDIETEKAADQTKKYSKAKSPAKPSEVDIAHGKKHNHSHTSPGQVEVSNFNSKESGLVQELSAEQEKYSPTKNCYEYYYPSYDGTFGEWENMGYGMNRAGHDLSYLVPIPRSDFQGALIPRNRLPHGNFVPHPSQGKGGLLAQSGAKSFIPNRRGWHSNDTLRMSGKFNLNGSFEKMAEQSRGPRANKIKGSPFADEISDKLNPAMRRDQYNLLEFETKYDHALFFVIKSFNEDDVHKSIKYNVWASTPSGNEKLDAAFRDAEKKSCEKGSRCPVFLFFSVNASGQFCGLAEMIGIFDFKKNMDFWQQGKWNGFFPVKWHIIKDIPNSQFRHIILKNNENKQVTNSRDTQEIELLQGLEMLKIFKDYAAKDSILDDFGYYERREKSLMKNRITSQLVGEDGEKTNPPENANHHSLVAHAKNLSLSGGNDGARAHPSRNS